MEKINWEQRRYELAKEAMQGIANAIWSSKQNGQDFTNGAAKYGKTTEEAMCGISLAYADEMIKQLRKD